MKTRKIKINFGNELFIKIFLTGLSYLLILLIFLISDFLPQSFSIREGDIAKEDIIAKKDGKYENRKETEKLKSIAVKNSEVVYYIDPVVYPSIRKKINSIFTKIKEARENNELKKIEDKVNWLKSQMDSIIEQKLPYYTLVTLIKSDPEQLEAIEEATELIVRYAVSRDLKQVQIAGAMKMIDKKSSELPLSEEYSKVVSEISKSVLLPNCLVDLEETQKLKDIAKSQIKPVMVSIKAGEIIIARGHIIEASHLDILKQLNMLDRGFGIKRFFGLTLSLLVLFSLFGLYLYKMEKEDLYSLKNLLFFSIVIISNLFLSRVLMGFSGYLTCLPAVAMFISVFFDYSLAIVFSVIINMIFAIFPGNHVNFIIPSLCGCIIGAFCVSKITKRFDLTTAGFIVGLTNFFTILGLSMINNQSFLIMLKDCLYGFAGGMLSAIFVLGVLPIFERYFDFVPQIRLLELANQAEPLLQRLLMEAPGSFQHSLIVANLSEKVAMELGANPLLARVGALYHDIGKIKRPSFFVENQMGENPHDKVSPTLSSLIVHSHVKDGIELAQKYRLPKAIKDFIPQHQGTGLVTYFYHKAKQGEHGDSVEEKDFRYPGPKPQSKEAAILMVADSVEAASRTLDKPTPAKIQGLVEKIIDKCLEDGQFDECDLSFKDLSIMTEVLSQVLTSMYHKRIEYPDDKKKINGFETKVFNFQTRKIDLKEGKTE